MRNWRRRARRRFRSERVFRIGLGQLRRWPLNATYDAGVGHGDLNAEFREPGEQNQLIYSVRRSERLVF
jgi:hypothetical protein